MSDPVVGPFRIALPDSSIIEFNTPEEAQKYMSEIGTSLPARWKKASLEQLAAGAALIDGLAKVRRLGSQVQKMIDSHDEAGGDDSEQLGDSGMSYAQAKLVQAMWAKLDANLQEPIGPGLPSTIDLMSELGA